MNVIQVSWFRDFHGIIANPFSIFKLLWLCLLTSLHAQILHLSSAEVGAPLRELLSVLFSRSDVAHDKIVSTVKVF